MGEGAELEVKVRSLKHIVEENAQRIDKIVDQICAQYNRDLDTYIDKVRDMLDRKDQLTDIEIEDLTLRVPVYLYFTAEGVEKIGIQLDSAKTVKSERFHDAYSKAEGTIGDKTAQAKLDTIPEELVQVCYERAYKKLKLKMEVAIQLCQATRKVLGKRIANIDIHKMEPNYTQNRED